jgi:hypothetical protein
MATVITPEESRVMAYLRRRRCVEVDELAAACLPGAVSGWVEQLLANLDWLGYVTLFPAAGAAPAVVQITERGAVQK